MSKDDIFDEKMTAEECLQKADDFMNGKHGETQDPETAVELYKMAVEKGSADAMFALGRCYINGQGVSADEKEGVRFFEKAAMCGQAGAQNYLGGLYFKGQGVEKDFAKAVMYFKEAAEQGLFSACRNLAICYEKGCGVTKDYTQAAFWYKKAADKNDEKSQKALERLKSDGVIDDAVLASISQEQKDDKTMDLPDEERKQKEEERKRKEEEMASAMAELQRRETELKRKEEEYARAEELRKKEEERRRKEEEHKRKEEEDRIAAEERKRKKEEDRIRKEEEAARAAEKRRKKDEERRREQEKIVQTYGSSTGASKKQPVNYKGKKLARAVLALQCIGILITYIVLATSLFSGSIGRWAVGLTGAILSVTMFSRMMKKTKYGTTFAKVIGRLILNSLISGLFIFIFTMLKTFLS